MELIESLNRTLKLALDDGTAASLEEAAALFQSFHVQIVVGREVASNHALQAALLTLLNAAPRTFHGEVTVTGELNFQFLLGWHKGQSVKAAVHSYGVRCSPLMRGRLSLLVGRSVHPAIDHPFTLHIACNSTGFSLSPDLQEESAQSANAIAGVAAAGAALNECFQYLYFQRLWAGQRVIEFVVPGLGKLHRLPQTMWMIGLGHLGQAALWTMGLALGNETSTPVLKLQDYDHVTKSSLSTGLLARAADVGTLKVEVAARDMRQLGYRCEPVSKLLELERSIQSSDEVCIVAVDSLGFRRQLDKLQGPRIVEAGVGDGVDGFTKSQLHILPGRRAAADIWSEGDSRASRQTNISAPAYQKLLHETGDECGTTQLAGRSIATPFIGAFVGALLYSLSISGGTNFPDSFALDANAL